MAAALLFPLSAAANLGCDQEADPDKENLRINYIAKNVVKRHAKHELRVIAGGKTLKFLDKAPYGEEMEGSRHTFCDRHAGLILILFAEDDEFSGKLINEATGQVSNAGHNVLVSPDRRAYFSIGQSSGMDGSNWRIHGADGRVSWSGHSFIEAEDKPGYISTHLLDPAWNAAGEMTASASCDFEAKSRWKVKLIKTAGKWAWSPLRKCPPG